MPYLKAKTVLLMACVLNATVQAQTTQATEDVPLLVMKDGLFDMSDADTRGLSEVPGAETITIYRAQDDTRKFSNHPQITWFKGHYYATWQATPKDEDSDDSVAVFSRSSDGSTWSQPVELAPALTGGVYHASGGWWTDGETLACLILRMDVVLPGKVKETIIRTTRDGQEWTPLEVLFPDTIASASPQMLSDGRIIFEGHGPVDFDGDGQKDTLGGRIWYTDDMTIFGQWKEATLPMHPVRRVFINPDDGTERNITYGSEHSLFERPDGKLTMLFRQSGARDDRTYRVWASVSDDRGQTWTVPKVTNMIDSCSMQCAGNLPDGTAYMVNCPNETFRRVPLALTLSDDGIHLDRAYLIRGGPPVRRYEGKYKTEGYSYPGAFIHNGYLWVSYATNKEDIEVTRIPLDAIMK
ncbi:MAG: exo-alpha-sialidase [Phycisphaeraceae bacterium]|nr:exo-alpha-sialidase [Phycisphaeraceae bacterium]